MTETFKTFTIEDLENIPPRKGVLKRADENYGPPLKLRPDAPVDLDDTGVRIDTEKGYVDIYWGGYEYSIDFSRIDTPAKLIPWLNHLSEKEWEGTTPARLLALLDKCARHFGWERYRISATAGD